jgi:hypothetical protein
MNGLNFSGWRQYGHSDSRRGSSGGLGRVFDVIVKRLQDDGHTVHLGKVVQRLDGSLNQIAVLVPA